MNQFSLKPGNALSFDQLIAQRLEKGQLKSLFNSIKEESLKLCFMDVLCLEFTEEPDYLGILSTLDDCFVKVSGDLARKAQKNY